MACAETESSPALYVEASQLLEQAKDDSSNEKTKILILGHSRFCRALEAGTEFADTRALALTFHILGFERLQGRLARASYDVFSKFMLVHSSLLAYPQRIAVSLSSCRNGAVFFPVPDIRASISYSVGMSGILRVTSHFGFSQVK